MKKLFHCAMWEPPGYAMRSIPELREFRDINATSAQATLHLEAEVVIIFSSLLSFESTRRDKLRGRSGSGNIGVRDPTFGVSLRVSLGENMKGHQLTHKR